MMLEAGLGVLLLLPRVQLHVHADFEIFRLKQAPQINAGAQSHAQRYFRLHETQGPDAVDCVDEEIFAKEVEVEGRIGLEAGKDGYAGEDVGANAVTNVGDVEGAEGVGDDDEGDGDAEHVQRGLNFDGPDQKMLESFSWHESPILLANRPVVKEPQFLWNYTIENSLQHYCSEHGPDGQIVKVEHLAVELEQVSRDQEDGSFRCLFLCQIDCLGRKQSKIRVQLFHDLSGFLFLSLSVNHFDFGLSFLLIVLHSNQTLEAHFHPLDSRFLGLSRDHEQKVLYWHFLSQVLIVFSFLLFLSNHLLSQIFHPKQQ
jgi:hypothetical protein